MDLVLSYNPSTDSWNKEMPMNIGRNSHAMISENDTAYVFGKKPKTNFISMRGNAFDFFLCVFRRRRTSVFGWILQKQDMDHAADSFFSFSFLIFSRLCCFRKLHISLRGLGNSRQSSIQHQVIEQVCLLLIVAGLELKKL